MTTNIDENIKSFRQIYSDCSDINDAGDVSGA